MNTFSLPALLLRLVLALAVLLVASGPAGAKEGFGIRRNLVTLERINPPEIRLPGEKISVVPKVTNAAYRPVAERLAKQTASELIQHDSRLSLDGDRPHSTIEVSVLQNEIEESWERRTRTKKEKIGEDSEGDPVYREREVQVRYKIVSHRFEASFVVQDNQRRQTLMADSIVESFSEDYQEGSGAPSRFELEGKSLGRAVREIVRRLAPTAEPLSVLLPKGSLKDFMSLAEAGLWSRYSEELESMSPLGDPADDSYRKYGLGLAYEALGYGAADLEVGLRYLERAASYYNQALSANPAEKYFSQPFKASFFAKVGKGTLSTLKSFAGDEEMEKRPDAPPPLERVQTALAKYQTLLSQETIIAEVAQATEGAKDLRGGAGGSSDAIGNEEVLAMVEAGLSAEIILKAIEDAESCRFDVSPMGLVELSKAGVPETIISELQSIPCS